MRKATMTIMAIPIRILRIVSSVLGRFFFSRYTDPAGDPPERARSLFFAFTPT
jgi:hypothetical protein